MGYPTTSPSLPQSRDDALNELRDLQGSYGDLLKPNFTAYTGLGKHDAHGYSQLLNARSRHAALQQLLNTGQ